MSKTVLIFGAGASREAGGPLMTDFMDRAEGVLNQGDDKASLDLIIDGIKELRGSLAKTDIDLNNIESLLGAFEMAQLCGRCGDLTQEQLQRLPDAVTQVITRTLELSIEHTVGERGIHPPEPYQAFGQQLSDRIRGKPGKLCCLTFNYDLCLEHALVWKNISYDYNLRSINPPAQIDVLKLHGSLNWSLTEQGVLSVSFEQMLNMLQPMFFERSKTAKIEWSILAKSAVEKVLAFKPFVVPPTFNKALYHSQIAHVWKRAADHLAEAEHIIFIGFSLPASDQFFRYLLALGTLSRARVKSINIFDPSAGSGEYTNRYHDVLSRQLWSATRFHDLPFGSAVTQIVNLIEL